VTGSAPTWSNEISQSALLDLAVRVAEEAGELLRRRVLEHHEWVETKSSASDIATDVDHAAEALIVRRLRECRPEDGIIAEEDHQIDSETGLTWVVDPLDGSTNFLYGMPPYSVSIAVCSRVSGSDVVPIAGALHDAAHRETFAAMTGAGAYLNGSPIAPAPSQHLATAIVGTGFSHTRDIRAAEIGLLHNVLPAIGDLRRSGSGATDLCWVACGRLDAFYQAGLKTWDFAAAQQIVAEAGGWFGKLPGIGGSDAVVVASAPGIRQALLDLLGEAGVR
jgi:myo-inositol-1(or 4)-monophosphatase